MSTIDSANPPQEFPDIVGARPTNPLAANFKSFIPASAHLAELTWPHLITGTILGIIFGASSLYLVLKVGLTVSASIPVAVLSITIFRVASKFFRSRDATIPKARLDQISLSSTAVWIQALPDMIRFRIRSGL
jgi:OPT oligopeptide transporter protein